MDRESVDRQTKHVRDVSRIESQLSTLTPEQSRNWLVERQTTASIRWESCNNSYRTLFMALNRHNKIPVDKFDIKIAAGSSDDTAIDTYIRVWRDRKTNTFNARPFTKSGPIEDHSFNKETFGSTYIYRHGTSFAKTATLVVNHDDVHPLIRLERIEGKQVIEQTPQSTAIFISSIDNHILPLLEDTEDTLLLIWDAVLNHDLNPDHAATVRLESFET